MKHRIVFLDRDTIAPHIRIRRPGFEHDWVEYPRTGREEIAGRIKDATILINNKVVLGADVLEAAPELKMIAVAATGTDNFDLDYCRKRGIVVSNIRGYAVHTVPEHTFALILALRRSLIGYREDVKAGAWQRAAQFCFFSHPIEALFGARLGIYGEGAIGQAVAGIGRAFGMQPVFAAHKGVHGLGPLYTPFDEVIETADVHTLHCPLLPTTRHMIGMAEFRRMKRTSILINTARGGLVADDDLARALEDGLIAGAAVDVLPEEPPADDNPLLALLDRPNFILTPHVAWASTEAMQALADQMIDNIENFVQGTPTNVVGQF